MSQDVRFAFAGDRDIAVRVLDYLTGSGHEPLALLLGASSRATHADELLALCPGLPSERIFRGKRFREETATETLRTLQLDFIVGVHFPYVIPPEVLELPSRGVLNLHPAYLPFNRGWHTPSWAILDQTPIGATLHFMDDGIDTGDMVAQERIEPGPGETADSLYQRLKELELEVFRKAWPSLADGSYRRTPQDPSKGTSHVKADLLTDEVRRIDMEQPMPAGELIRRLRALTTSDPAEAAWFERDGRRFRIRVAIEED